MTTNLRTSGIVVTLFMGFVFVSCSSSGGSSDDTDTGTATDADADADTDTDTDADTDTDVDTDVDSDSDTDTDTTPDTDWDGGPTEHCPGTPQGNMVCVPGGKYLMGCMPYDTDCEDNEKPMVEVTLSPFWIDQEETTFQEVLAFLNTDGIYREVGNAYRDKPGHPGEYEQLFGVYAGGAPIALDRQGYYFWNRSMEGQCTVRQANAAAGGLSWLGAKAYCEWKGKQLPTEAQWEAAARGQTKLIYPCAWYHLPCWYGSYDCGCSGGPHECSMCAECCVPFEAKDEDFCPSPFGVQGMYGNAAEWVLDHRDKGAGDHSNCASGCTDPPPSEGEWAIQKGGDIGSIATRTRISNRTAGLSASWNNGRASSGVRCVKPATAK